MVSCITGCVNSGDNIYSPIHSHKFTWVIDVEPTYLSPGVQHKECLICGYKTDENTVIQRNMYNEVIYEEVVDPTLPGMKSFNSANELKKFMSDNEEKLDGSFIYLDLSDAKENGIHIPFTSPPAYTFEYKEGKGGCYTNARLITWFELYVEELGTDTDIEYDVPYHSISLYLVSNECADEIKDLSFEFYKYSNSHEKWNYVVKINNQNGVCIADMYYYTGLEIDREWIVSFITQKMETIK